MAVLGAKAGWESKRRDRVYTMVFDRLDRWEREHRTGSARQPFEAFWRDACVLEGVDPLTRAPKDKREPELERERCWRNWLRGGPRLTKERQVELLAGVGLRYLRWEPRSIPPAKPWDEDYKPAGVPDAAATRRILSRREPGEEG